MPENLSHQSTKKLKNFVSYTYHEKSGHQSGLSQEVDELDSLGAPS